MGHLFILILIYLYTNSVIYLNKVPKCMPFNMLITNFENKVAKKRSRKNQKSLPKGLAIAFSGTNETSNNFFQTRVVNCSLVCPTHLESAFSITTTD